MLFTVINVFFRDDINMCSANLSSRQFRCGVTATAIHSCKIRFNHTIIECVPTSKRFRGIPCSHVIAVSAV